MGCLKGQLEIIYCNRGRNDGPSTKKCRTFSHPVNAGPDRHAMSGSSWTTLIIENGTCGTEPDGPLCGSTDDGDHREI